MQRYDCLNPQPDLIVQSWGTASSGKELSDYSVGTTWLVKGHQLLFDGCAAQTPILKKAVIDYARQYCGGIVLVKSKGSSMFLIQDLRAADLSVIACRPDANKTTRMAIASILLESGAVLLPHDAVWLDDYEVELFAFPLGRNDDQVDSTSHFLNWFIKQ